MQYPFALLYDVNGFFQGLSPAQPHPVISGEWLPPYNGLLVFSDNDPNRLPPIQQGKWPCWTGNSWEQVEDRRKRENLPDLVARYGADYPQEATEYWLPDDTHESPARTMKEVGPLPDRALLERPAKPEPTVFEKITEVQAPFLEQQALAKNDFVTAQIEGDAELEAEAQADYQASVDAMKQATSEMTGG